ncbi:MAG: histidine utilization repressor [Proteobacteria bacterium]|nr:histidine utilization repressor [Pseudomonadota bacterium]
MNEYDDTMPAYEQVKRFITDHIQSGKWEAGRRVPSEIELVEQLGVSKMTVNRAMRELTAAGIIVRRQGVGSFVSKTKPQSALLEMRDIAEEIEARGNRHSAEMKVLETITLEKSDAEAIGMRAGLRVFHSLIVHRENDTPVQLEERWIDPAVFPNYISVDFSKVTPYRYLRGSVEATEIEHIIHAILPNPQARELLEVPDGEPCLLLFRRTWAGDTLATSSQFLFPGSGYALGSRYRLDSLGQRPNSLPLSSRVADDAASQAFSGPRPTGGKKRRGA